MTSYPREMLKAGAAVVCRCEGPQGIAMTHAEITAAVLDATLGLSQAELDIIAERRRQVTDEGWLPEFDDKYTKGELANGAASYALIAGEKRGFRAIEPFTFPAHWRAWFRSDYNAREMLIQAGALIAAEIERLDRAAAKAATTPEPTP